MTSIMPDEVGSQQTPEDSLLSRVSAGLATLASRVAPAVVAVSASRGAGSGFFVTPDGYLLTNSHVVSSREVTVVLADGDSIPGDLVGRDKKTDLAVIRIRSTDRQPFLPLIDKRRVRVGQIVLAMGSPLNFQKSVSLGVVSAIDRFLPSARGASLEGLIQTDAAINPGNSGGPLTSTEAEVVGVNTAIIPFAQGLGFAVAGYTAHWVLSEIMHHGRVVRRTIGVAARSVDLPMRFDPSHSKSRAILIVKVEPHSPAERAGLKQGDLITEARGESLWNVDDLQRLLTLGDAKEVPIVYIREFAVKNTILQPESMKHVA